jgi:hypothetical protein
MDAEEVNNCTIYLRLQYTDKLTKKKKPRIIVHPHPLHASRPGLLLIRISVDQLHQNSRAITLKLS